MQKSVLILGAIALFSVMSVAYAEPIDFSQCQGVDHHCYTYKPGTNLYPKAGSSWTFNMFMPDGICNVKGMMNPTDGTCNVKPLQLSDGNMTLLKMNPGVFAIRDIGNVNDANINYCPVGLSSVLHEDGYFYKVKNVTNYMYPDFCIKETGPNPFPVPEFPVAALVMAVIVSLVIVIGRMSDGHWTWKI